MSSNNNKVIIFYTTMRDGELTTGVKINVQEKICITQVLEEMGVDIIEVGYPGHAQKDFDEISTIAELIKKIYHLTIASRILF